MISSCPNYLHADVSDGEDLSRHQQEVTGGQLVTMSLVPGAVRSTRVSTLGYVPFVSRVNDLQITTQAQIIIFP